MNRQLATAVPGVSAIPECCEVDGQIFGMVAPCMQQAEVLADRKAELCSKLVQAECPTEAGMGLGWESFLIDGKRYLMHTGADAGTFTFGYFSPDTRSGVVVLTNSSNGAKAVLPVLRLIGKDEAFVDFLQRLVEPRP